MSDVSLDISAVEDVNLAAAWYEEQRAGLGVEFVLEIDAVMQRIGETPKAFPVVYAEFRRALPKRFPYAVYFRFDGTSSRVFAVLDQRRSPDEVDSRLGA